MKYSPFVVVAEEEGLNFIAFRGFSSFFSEVYFLQRFVCRVPLFTKNKDFERKIIL